MATEPFNLDQMRLVSTVAAEGSFSRAASALGVTQSAVSQQVRAIETALGRQLLVRGARGITVTGDGEAYLVYARAMMKVGADAQRHFAGPPAKGVIRLGLTEDFARTVLPSVLAIFCRQHPGFALEVECGLSSPLFAGIDDGRYAAVIAKRRAGRAFGERLWSEPTLWYGRADTPHPVPDLVDLVLIPAPSETRDVILEALGAAGRPWRAIFQSLSFATLEAAVQAGVGVTGLGSNLHGPGLVELGEDAGLPALADVDIVMERNPRETLPAVEAFCSLVRAAALLSAGQGHLDEEQPAR